MDKRGLAVVNKAAIARGKNMVKFMTEIRIVLIGTAFLFVTAASAQRQMEQLDRGVVAIGDSGGNVYLGWRFLKTDSAEIAFNVYRSTTGAAAVKLNDAPITQSTNFVDTSASLDLDNTWRVGPVLNGKEQEASGRAAISANSPGRQYKSIGLQGNLSVHKVGIADLDGDGVYDFVVKRPGGGIDPGTQRKSPDTFKVEAYNGKTGRVDSLAAWRR